MPRSRSKSSDGCPRPCIRPSILLDSSVSRTVAVVFSGPRADAGEPASRVRRSYFASPRPLHTRTRSSVAAKDFRSVIVVRSGRYWQQPAPTVDVFDNRSEHTLVPQYWLGQQSVSRCTRRSKPRAPIVANDCFVKGRARARHKTVRRRGGGLQCERRTRFTGSSTRSGPVKTMATAARPRLYREIDGPHIHREDTYEDS